MTLSVLFIDNFDSFSFNLVDEFRRRQCAVQVWRNDLSAEEAMALAEQMPQPRLIVLSPGPGAPAEAGCCLELIRAAAGKVPVFGICLGHQAIVEAFGGTVGPAGETIHGKTSLVEWEESLLFASLPNPFSVGRYHSLAAQVVPAELRTTARLAHLPMAVEHRTARVAGVQFHPESILTPQGGQLLDNVVAWAKGASHA